MDKEPIDGTFQELETIPKPELPVCRKGRPHNEAAWVYNYVPPELAEEPWAQWPHESGKAYRAFLVYRDMGVDRRLQEVARILHNRYAAENDQWVQPHRQYPMYLRNWCKAYLWHARVDAWDRYIFRLQDQQWIDRQKQLRERQWDSSETLFKLGISALETMKSSTLTAKDVARFLELASKLGAETKQEGITADYLRAILGAFPDELRNEVIRNLKQG